MLPLGLLLVLAGGALGVAVALHNTDAATLTAFGQVYDTTVLGVFLTGAAAGAAVLAGLGLILGAAGRRRRRRRELKARVVDVRTENEQLAEENARLRDAMDEGTVIDAGDPYPAETGASETSSRRGRHTVK